MKISLTFFFSDYDDFLFFYISFYYCYEPVFRKERKFIIIRFSRIMKDYEEL